MDKNAQANSIKGKVQLTWKDVQVKKARTILA
jgi:hypothetical protein